MSKHNSNNPIFGFVASILNLILIVIVVKVILIYAESREAGKETNIAKVATTEVRVLINDITEAWTAEKDTTE